MLTLFTIGHSTRSADGFLSLLQSAGIKMLADVRAIPASRRHPQFNVVALAASLAAAGITYVPLRKLGGRRAALPHSLNTGLGEGLRGFADYMQSAEFSTALSEVLALAVTAPTTIMCAEANYLNCHRQLIADAALVRGATVLHIAEPSKTLPHALSRQAMLEAGVLTYPARQPSLFQESA